MSKRNLYKIVILGDSA